MADRDPYIPRLGLVLEQDVLVGADRSVRLRPLIRDLIDDVLLDGASRVLVAAPAHAPEPGTSPAETEPMPDGAEAFLLGDRSRGGWRFSILPRLWRLTALTDAGYVIFPSWRSIVAGWAYRLRGKPYVVAAVGPPVGDGPLGALRWRAMASVGKHAAFVVAAGTVLERFFRDAGARTFPTGPMLRFEPSDLRDRDPSLVHAPIRCLYVGTLYPAKRVEDLIQAVALLRTEHGLEARLRCAGDGDPRQLAQLAASLGVSDAVDFVGHVTPGPALTREYDEADVLVFASLAEGFPRVFYEAAFASLPIVTTPAGSISEMLTDGRDCVIVGFRDPAAIASAVARLATDTALRARLIGGERALAQVALDDPYPESLRALMRSHLEPALRSGGVRR